MSGIFWLDWAALALSLTNTILLVWLGTTVLINVEERSWGGWLAAAGLYLGGIFFISHTAILGYGLNVISIGTTLWWVVGLLAISILPLLWYVMMLWYSGYWESLPDGGSNPLGKRHRWWFVIAVIALIGLIGTAFFFQQVPAATAYPARGLTESPVIRGVPVTLGLFPIYVILCMGLSLDAVLHPGPSDRLMGEQARKQAQPWLISASVALLAVSLGVLGVFLWFYFNLDGLQLTAENILVIEYFDVVIQLLIAGAVILVGQAVVAYEIFTGQSLPRKGFLRQWQYAVLLAVGFGVVVGFVFSTNLRPVYGILFATLMMTFFLALFSWQTVTERQRSIRRLRPFVSSQGFYDHLLAGDQEMSPSEKRYITFEAMCREVLDTRKAYLVAQGPMAPLAGDPVGYDSAGVRGEITLGGESLRSLTKIAQTIRIEDLIIPYADVNNEAIHWLVPLWSQRGLAGVLLIGEKREGGIYSREEIEIAQSTSERLIDGRVSAEIASRLLSLQRQRLAQSQVVDQRTRRLLHDEILQDIHAAILKLAGSDGVDAQRIEDAIEMMTRTHAEISRLLRNMPGTSLTDLGELGLVDALNKLVDDEVSAKFENVTLGIEPEAAEAAEQLSRLEQEVLYYAAREAIRNAARHGRPEGGGWPLNLQIDLSADDHFILSVEDDGVGLGNEKNHQESGGQGLSLHSTMMGVIGGELKIESEEGRFTRVILKL